MRVTADAPDVQVVNIDDASDGAHFRDDGLEFHRAGRAFEKDIQALANNADRRPQDHASDGNGECRVNPAMAGDHDGPASGDDRCRGESVANLVNDYRAQIQVATAAKQQHGDGAVEQYSDCGDPHNQPGANGHRMGDTLDRAIHLYVTAS